MTIRSSSEWNVTTARRPPGLSSRSAAHKPAHELLKFVVDRDAQSLEGARRGMGELAMPRGRDARDEPGKLERRGERLCLAVGDDGARDSARGALLAEIKQNIGDRRLVFVAQDVGGRTAGSSHAHIEGRVEAEREAARGFVELHGGHPDVERDPVHRIDGETPHDLVELAKARLNKLQPPPGRRSEFRAGANRRRVAIERNHARAAFEKRAR